jgi:hypothetical protein
MKDKKNTNGYQWDYCSLGGVVRVNITSGEDIAHLGELDQKLWTVLSCPVKGLEFDADTLKLLDTDGDGKIRVPEVVAAAEWLTAAVKDKDSILKGESSIALDAINTESEIGKALHESAKQILANLGKEKDCIGIEDTSDSVAIFKDTKFNGDGIITVKSSDDEAEQKLIETIGAKTGTSTDRNGEPGITAENIETFYAALADYAAWQDAAEAGKKEIFPYGDDTEAALTAVDAIKDKVADYFMRCKLIGFDPATAGAVDVSVDKIAAIEGNLADASGEIALQPLAKPSADGKLLLGAVNPAWKGAVDKLVELTGIKEESLTEADWNALAGRFAPYTAWMDAKKGGEVEGLGLEAVKAILKEDRKAALLALVEEDKAEEANALSIEEVDKVLRLQKHFYRFLNNYVVLADFYDPGRQAIFQAGRLYIDQRSTDLCVKVAGPAPEISSLSGMYILYCACTSEKLGKSFNIAAVLTDGDVDGLRVGKNAVFYDREGNDYTAQVVAIVENPLSIRQAFWAPYKKVARFISDRIDKKAAEKNEKSMAGLTTATNNAADGKAATTAAVFDIAKFAGIFAAIGMALGLVGAALAGVVAALKGITWWQVLIVIAVVMLIISGPSMFIAWRKLRKRDLGPVLNANGWAINANALVNTKFGKTLTSLAKFPKLTAVDAEARKKAARRRFWCWFCGIIIVAAVALWLFNVLAPIGIKSPLKCYNPDPVEECCEAPCEAEAEPQAELPAEETAE